MVDNNNALTVVANEAKEVCDKLSTWSITFSDSVNTRFYENTSEMRKKLNKLKQRVDKKFIVVTETLTNEV